MTLATFAAAIATTKIPMRYGYWPDENRPKCPYIEYEVAYTSNFGGDNKVYQRITHIDLFLFTDKKDLDSEAAIEQALDDAEIFWDKTESFSESEKTYQILYEVTIYG